jgi:hypothetical protein
MVVGSADLEPARLAKSYIACDMYQPAASLSQAWENEHEFRTVSTVLGGLLREVLSEADLLNSIASMQDEPIPTYRSLRAGLFASAEEPSTIAHETSRSAPASLHTAEGILDQTLSNLLLELLEGQPWGGETSAHR